MAYKPLRMDKRELINKYKKEGVSIKKIARLVGVSKNTVRSYTRNQTDLVNDLNECKDFTPQKSYEQESDKDIRRDIELQALLPGYNVELSRVGVSRQLLWEGYKTTYPDGFSYSRFCRKLKFYRKQQSVTIRIEHKAAYRLSVDYTGKKIAWVRLILAFPAKNFRTRAKDHSE